MAVTTSLSAGTLTITGDAAADDIAIVGTSNPGEFTVTGRNGTEVNGVANGSATIGGVSGDLVAILGDGHNAIRIDNVFTAGDISITTGTGDDRVTIGATNPVSPAGDLLITTGDGHDIVEEDTTIYNTFVVGVNRIQTGDGSDSISLYGASAIGGIFINSGPRNDNVLVVGTTSAADLTILGANGTNSIAVIQSSSSRGVYASGGDGPRDPNTEAQVNIIYFDTIYSQRGIEIFTGTNHFAGGEFVGYSTTANVFHCLASSFRYGGHGGVNRVTLIGNAINGPQYIDDFYGVVIRPYIQIGTPAGFGSPGDDNTISLQYNITETLVASTGVGDDTYSLVGNLMTLATRLLPDGGIDRLALSGNSLAAFTAPDFEIVQ
jgi:hypothetical protein